MKRSLSAIFGGMALGLTVAMGLGLMVGTLNSFTGFSHAVRPGSKCTLSGESVAIGTEWTEVASLIAMPAGALFMWRQTQRLPLG